jgi:hypothetical protein
MDLTDPNQPVNDLSTVSDGVQQSSSPATSSNDTPVQDSPQAELQSASNEVASGENNYIANVGGSVIRLLATIYRDEQSKQKVAETMRLPVEQVTSILEGLVEKLKSEQLTEAELALIMTSPVAETADEKQTSA